MKSKVWFITGSSRGFGRVWVEAALKRGDKVVATAHAVASLVEYKRTYGDAVVALALDVTDRGAIATAVRDALGTFGRLDVLVNNAGYGSFGAVEEVTEVEPRAQMETNLFGALWLTQAVPPTMRNHRFERILMISSIGGIAAFPSFGLYHASRSALEWLADSLSQQVAVFGIGVTLVDPGTYSTDWGGSSAKRATELPAYAEMHAASKRRSATNPKGDPDATDEAILKGVDAEKPPLRIFLGTTGLRLAKQTFAERLATWEKWNDVSYAAQKKSQPLPLAGQSAR